MLDWLSIYVHFAMFFYLVLDCFRDGIVGRLLIKLQREYLLDDVSQGLRHLLEELAHVLDVDPFTQVVLKLVICIFEFLVEV